MKQKKKTLQYKTEEQAELFRFALVLVVVIAIVFGVYFLSKKLVVDESLFEVSYKEGSINYERAIVGTIFNRPYSEYYVMVYDETKPEAVYYSSLSTQYTKRQEGALHLYHVNLASDLNKDAYVGSDGASNSKATKASELKFKDLTLIKIKNGKIVKYLEKESDIQNELKITKEKES